MVTCQSANQLKTPAKFSRAFKIVSQLGALSYIIMRKTADLTVVQKTIIDTLHKEGKPQTFIVIVKQLQERGPLCLDIKPLPLPHPAPSACFFVGEQRNSIYTENFEKIPSGRSH